MTVSTATARVAYSGSGSTGPFTIPFYFLANSHIRAVKLAGGVETELTLTTDYTLTGAGDEDGGELTLVVALASGETLTIVRNVPVTQETDWPVADPFPAVSHERAADKLTMIVQQINDTVGRTVRQPVSDAATIAELPIKTARASKFLAFDADGDPTAADGSDGTTGSLAVALAASGGAALVGVVQSGTGSIARTAQDKMRELVSVLDKGADDTGSADSTAAFSNAVGVAGFALVPPGTYKLDSDPDVGMYLMLPGVTLTGSGTLADSNQMIFNGTASGIPFEFRSNRATAQIIGHRVETGFNQTGTVSALSFGQTIEAWTPTVSTAVYNGAATGAYGSFSHFGSGNLASGYGGSFEGFNPGAATATLIVGVSGHAKNGGVVAGVPEQTPSNDGAATNIRAIDGAVSNLSSGTVTNAAIFYGEAAANSGGGSITNLYGLYLPDLTEGGTNYSIFGGSGLYRFGDAVSITSNAAIPAATNDGALWLAGGGGGLSQGRIYVGNASGRRLQFVSRTASTDTVVGYVRDNGQIVGTGGCLSDAGVNGYTTGAGGTITQGAGSGKSTGVTLNTSSGQITMNNAALAGGASVNFNFTNSKLTATSMIVTSIRATGATTGAYTIRVSNMQSGVCTITVQNETAGSLSEAIIINFALIAGATS